MDYNARWLLAAELAEALGVQEELGCQLGMERWANAFLPDVGHRDDPTPDYFAAVGFLVVAVAKWGLWLDSLSTRPDHGWTAEFHYRGVGCTTGVRRSDPLPHIAAIRS